MKLTIEQKQKIYEHLLSLDCPDLLAALIAERSVIKSSITSRKSSIIDNFTWEHTPEGRDFWETLWKMYGEYESVFLVGQEYEDALQESLKDDFESPTELDLPKEGSIPPKIEVNVEGWDKHWFTKGSIHGSLTTKSSPSFVDRVKLFFGKIFYKV
jgi:hypothetical protein